LQKNNLIIREKRIGILMQNVSQMKIFCYEIRISLYKKIEIGYNYNNSFEKLTE